MIHYLYPLIAAILWGGNSIATKASAGVIGPAEITFWRWIVAIAVMSPFVLPGFRRRMLRGRHLWRLAVLGLLGGAGFPLLSYLAAAHTSALNIGLIQATMPVMSLLLAIMVLGQVMTPGAALGGLVSLAGVAVVVTEGDPAALLAQAPNPGDALMVAAVLCYAVYSVLLKRWQLPVGALQSLYVQNIAAALAVAPLWLMLPRHGLDAGNLGLVFYAGVMASFAAPLGWMLGVAAIGPARASMFFNLIPVVTAILAVLLLGEHMTLPLFLGGALTIAGVVLAENWRGRRRISPGGVDPGRAQR